jgi:hypothetical protein
MRVRKRSTLRRKNLFLSLGFILPIIICGMFAGFVDVMMKDLISFVYEIPTDPQANGFYSLDDIDTDALYQMANTFEDRLEKYHLPINLTLQTVFDLNGNVVRYSSTDNAGLWTGASLGAECLRYQYLKTHGGSSEEIESSLRIIRKLVHGLSMLLEVPNGGLGPEFPGIIARFYASPEQMQDGNFSWMLSENYKHFNGSGKYQNWRCRLYTSKDELGGNFFGYALALKYAQDDPYVNRTIHLMIAQVVESFISTYWQELHGDGTPCGSHLQPIFGSGSEWKLLVMKMAALAFPENQKYQQLYNYYISREILFAKSPQLSDYQNIEAYYAFAFSHHVILGLILLEDNQALLDCYINNYDTAYKFLKGHRNAYFNAIYLVMNKLRSSPTPAQFNITYIRWDVLDQLWRFNTTGWCPMDDTYGNENVTISRLDLDPLGINFTIIDPKIQKWRDFFNSPIGQLWSFAPSLLTTEALRTRYVYPVTVGMYSTGDFIWGDNPFDDYGGHGRHSTNRVYESSGSSFTLPFWLMKAFDYI